MIKEKVARHCKERLRGNAGHEMSMKKRGELFSNLITQHTILERNVIRLKKYHLHNFILD